MIAHLVGFMGAILAIIAYFLLTSGRCSPQNMLYLTLNISGSVLILVSLHTHPNLASTVINIAWISISLIGLAKAWLTRNI